MSELRCSACDKRVLPHAAQVGELTDFVEIKAETGISTAYKEGYPSDGHLATTFAGVYCSLVCAVQHLSEHLATLADRMESRAVLVDRKDER